MNSHGHDAYPEDKASLKATMNSYQKQGRKYPTFNILVNPMFPCIPCEKFATELSPFRHYVPPECVLVDHEGSNDSIEHSSNRDIGDSEEVVDDAECCVIDENNNSVSSDEDQEYEDITEDRGFRSRCVMRELAIETHANVFNEPSNAICARNDPDETTEFLCRNRLVASFLSVVSTIGEAYLVRRIVRYFPTISELVSDPEVELNRYLKVFSQEDFTNLATAFVDQYEETGTFDGPFCQVEMETLLLSQRALENGNEFCDVI